MFVQFLYQVTEKKVKQIFNNLKLIKLLNQL